MGAYLLTGIVFGLSGGLAPGPLLTLVISETIKYDLKAGIKVAIAPLLSDLPLVTVSLLVLQQLASLDVVYGIISLVGAAFIAYLAFENMRVQDADVIPVDAIPHSIRKGLLTNVLNPHPYIFWLTIGAPTVIAAYEESIWVSVAFIVPFYMSLIGSKVLLAVLVARSKTFLQAPAYRITMRILGITLGGLALLFLWDGLRYLNLI